MVERSRIATRLLQMAGWFPDREIELAKIRSLSEVRNLKISPIVEEFLLEFDKIYYHDDRIREGYKDIIDINLEKYSDYDEYEKETLNDFLNLRGIRLTIIGISYCTQGTLMICENGKIWVSYYGISLESIEIGVSWNEVVNSIAEEWAAYLISDSRKEEKIEKETRKSIWNIFKTR